jgi:hypothetical protein
MNEYEFISCLTDGEVEAQGGAKVRHEARR